MNSFPGFPVKDAPLWQNCISAAGLGIVAALGFLALCVLLSGCAGKKPAKRNVIEVPKHCVIVDNIWECDARNICKAHVTIKPNPECNAYRSDVLQVKK